MLKKILFGPEPTETLYSEYGIRTRCLTKAICETQTEDPRRILESAVKLNLNSRLSDVYFRFCGGRDSGVGSNLLFYPLFLGLQPTPKKYTLKNQDCLFEHGNNLSALVTCIAHGFRLPPKDDRNFIPRLLFKDTC